MDRRPGPGRPDLARHLHEGRRDPLERRLVETAAGDRPARVRAWVDDDGVPAGTEVEQRPVQAAERRRSEVVPGRDAARRRCRRALAQGDARPGRAAIADLQPAPAGEAVLAGFDEPARSPGPGSRPPSRRPRRPPCRSRGSRRCPRTRPRRPGRRIGASVASGSSDAGASEGSSGGASEAVPASLASGSRLDPDWPAGPLPAGVAVRGARGEAASPPPQATTARARATRRDRIGRDRRRPGPSGPGARDRGRVTGRA